MAESASRAVAKIEEDIDSVEQTIRGLNLRLEDLKEERFHVLNAELGLPQEPGWYLNGNGEIARLDEHGIWDDGWGNPALEYGIDLEGPFVKLVPESKEET